MEQTAENLRGVERLLIRGLNWIGDAVMSLPTLALIRLALPTARITALAPEWCADIYRLCPDVDDTMALPPRRGRFALKGELELVRTVRRGKFDAAIILPNSLHSAIAPFAAGIPLRIGYGTDARGFLLTGKISPPRGSRSHTVLYYRPLLESLGIPWSQEKAAFHLALYEDTIRESEDILTRRGAADGSIRIGFSPGAAWGSAKRWPAEHFALTAQNLLAAGGREALFFGSPADHELVDGIVRAAGCGVNLAGAFPHLGALAAALRSCELLITNDSGPMHLAAAVGTPVIALFGPTDEMISGPWSPGDSGHLIIRAPGCSPCYNPRCNADNPCLARITAEQVTKAAEEQLASMRERQ